MFDVFWQSDPDISSEVGRFASSREGSYNGSTWLARMYLVDLIVYADNAFEYDMNSRNKSQKQFFFLYMSITCPYTTVNWHATWKTTSLSGSLGISQHQPGRLRCISFIWPLAYKLGKPGHRVHSGQVINQPKDSLVCWDCLPVIFGVSKNHPSALNLSFQHRTI